jgi:DNA-binding transcriptional MerR regulator
MGLQQASLDFFNTPPEEKKTAEKLPVPVKEMSPETTEVYEAEPTVASATPGPTPGPPLPVTGQETEEIINNASLQPQPEIQVDEKVRDLDFVVTQHKTVTIQAGRKSTRGRMKLSDMDVLVDLVDVPADEVLFQKRYYNIGAVSDMFKVNISLIRFWENEFDILKPKKNGKGDRLFRPEDIKNLQLIYHLLREKKYTIDGAKDFLKKNKKAEDSFAVIDSLKKIKSFLLELKSNL